jgi:hypothetical protein
MRLPLLFAVGGLVLALGAIGAVIYVLAEPAAAINTVRDDPGGLSTSEQGRLIEERYHEASVPLLAASICGALALGAALAGRRRTLGAAAILVACISLAGAAYLWGRYGDGIWRKF